MNRLDFCKLMEQAKTASGIPASEISFSMKMLMPTLRRFEKGEHNFSLVKVMEYLKVLHAQLVIYNDKSTVACTEYSQLIAWLVSARKDGYPQRKLAEVIGISYVMLARIESNKSSLSIDIFLKIIEVLGYSVNIKSL
ncbi:MAG: helix-turn-helix domain-containing protein [Phocaeicola sp.]